MTPSRHHDRRGSSRGRRPLAARARPSASCRRWARCTRGTPRSIRAARAASGFVVVSIFVNPTQFGPKEDFAKYPRTLEADQKVCAEAGADLIFAPAVDEMYPARSVTFVEVKELDAVLCGASRPGHFRGVCTVVLKLSTSSVPTWPTSARRTYQQARIIQQMVRDLNVPVAIRVEPTVREADGLALSSRNRYLSPAERAAAPRIYQALQSTRDRARAGEIDAARLESALNAELTSIPGARSRLRADRGRRDAPPAGPTRPPGRRRGRGVPRHDSADRQPGCVRLMNDD